MNFDKIPSEGNPQETAPDIPEQNGTQERDNKEMLPEIKDAQTFEELYDALDRIGELHGSGNKTYSAEELKKRIGLAREGQATMLTEWVTRTGGLRKKVRELLEKEKE